jgi:ABC-2 type transport system ATP-binding protein
MSIDLIKIKDAHEFALKIKSLRKTYGGPKAQLNTDTILETVGLTDKANAYTRTLSGGMQRRLLVAKAMVYSPPNFTLDEPSAGVGVVLRRQLWENVKEMNAMGITPLLITDYLE